MRFRIFFSLFFLSPAGGAPVASCERCLARSEVQAAREARAEEEQEEGTASEGDARKESAKNVHHF